jgi:hypothetical protein
MYLMALIFRPEFFLNNELREDFMYIFMMYRLLVLHIELLPSLIFYFGEEFYLRRSTDSITVKFVGYNLRASTRLRVFKYLLRDISCYKVQPCF